MEPGEYFLRDGMIEINAGRRTVTLQVSNTGDRAIQVGSHFHFLRPIRRWTSTVMPPWACT